MTVDHSLPPDVRELLSLFAAQTSEHAIILLKPDASICYLNPAAEAILGHRSEDVLGQSLSLIFTEKDRDMGVVSLEMEVAAKAGFAEDDRWHLRKDGARIWVTGTLTALKNENGELLGFAKVLRDRTDLKAHLAALENQLQVSLKDMRVKDEFFARLAHEIRNCLSPLRNVVAQLRYTRPDGSHDFALSIAERQLALLARLAQDSASLATLGVGKLQLIKERFNLAERVSSVAESLKSQSDAKRQTVDVLLIKEPVMVDADPDRLQQVVYNLLHNAIKYTPQGGHIWVKLTVEGNQALLRVRDTGIGIDADLLPKVFQLFTQASVAHSSGGLGIGLALVRELVQAHGGFVEARSDGLGKGSEFTVRLSLASNTGFDGGVEQA